MLKVLAFFSRLLIRLRLVSVAEKYMLSFMFFMNTFQLISLAAKRSPFLPELHKHKLCCLARNMATGGEPHFHISQCKQTFEHQMHNCPLHHSTIVTAQNGSVFYLHFGLADVGNIIIVTRARATTIHSIYNNHYECGNMHFTAQIISNQLHSILRQTFALHFDYIPR